MAVGGGLTPDHGGWGRRERTSPDAKTMRSDRLRGMEEAGEEGRQAEGMRASVHPREREWALPSGHHVMEATIGAPLRPSPARLITCGHGVCQGLTTQWRATGDTEGPSMHALLTARCKRGVPVPRQHTRDRPGAAGWGAAAPMEGEG